MPTLNAPITAADVTRPWLTPTLALGEACAWSLFNRRIALSLARCALAGAALTGDKVTARAATALMEVL